jgi:hypothetical protein
MGVDRQKKNQEVQSLLLQSGVACEVRPLAVGDMLWIIRRTQPPPPLAGHALAELTRKCLSGLKQSASGDVMA